MYFGSFSLFGFVNKGCEGVQWTVSEILRCTAGRFGQRGWGVGLCYAPAYKERMDPLRRGLVETRQRGVDG